MLDPHVRSLIEFCAANQVPAFSELAPQAARQAYLDGRIFTQPEPEAVAWVHDLEAPVPGAERGVAVRVYCASPPDLAQPLPVVVFCHGGGWVMGNLETHDTLCRQLANRTRCAIVAVDYRLAPEHPFPAAFQDAWAVLLWLLEAGAGLGLDATRMAVAGDSAGGNLAAALALAHRNHRRAFDPSVVPLRQQVLVYPVTQLMGPTQSWSTWGEGYLLSRADLMYFHHHYLGRHPAPERDWRHSPLLADDHTDLAPALVLTAGHDPLRDDGVAYAQRLADSGNPVSYLCFERQIHGFVLMGKLLPEAATAVDLIAATLLRALAPQAALTVTP